MNNDSKWISIKDQHPTIDCKVRAVLALVEGNYRIYHVWPGDCNFPGMTHWQPLPELPTKPDPFEEFWNHDVLRAIGTAGLASTALKAWCKQAFEAGIASTQNK